MKVFGKRSLSETPPPRQPLLSAAPLAPLEALPVAEEDTPSVRARPEWAALRERVLKEVDPAVAAGAAPLALRRQVEEIIHDIANHERVEMSASEQQLLAEDLTNDMVGYGPLQPLLEDETVSDIMVNGPGSVYVERRGNIERTQVRFRDGEHIASVAQKIAARVGRRIDESSPMVDARLSDGSRVNVIFPPLAIDSPCISIRKFPTYRLNLDGLVANGSMSEALARLLEIATRCRLNMLVSGGTGSGKTTLLNALSRCINPRERIITIEDAAELQLQQPHVIRLETRPPSLEGTGQVTQRDLLWNALRMRPDRIIIGEVRGAEAFDMLQAMNTGHDGSISTVHANSARDALTRVENMVQMGHVNLPQRAIRSQLVSALDLIIQVERMRDGQRRVMQITEVVGMEGEIITTNDVALFTFERDDPQGRIHGHYAAPKAIPAFMSRLAYYGLDRAWAEAAREI